MPSSWPRRAATGMPPGFGRQFVEWSEHTAMDGGRVNRRPATDGGARSSSAAATATVGGWEGPTLRKNRGKLAERRAGTAAAVGAAGRAMTRSKPPFDFASVSEYVISRRALLQLFGTGGGSLAMLEGCATDVDAPVEDV